MAAMAAMATGAAVAAAHSCCSYTCREWLPFPPLSATNFQSTLTFRRGAIEDLILACTEVAGFEKAIRRVVKRTSLAANAHLLSASMQVETY